MNSNLRTFKGKTIYVGIDVHLKSWSIALYMDEVALKKFTLSPPNPNTLSQKLKEEYVDANFLCCYEAGFSGFWIKRNLDRLGLPTLIANPADIPTTDRELRRKNDVIDANKIVKALRAGLIESIYVPSLKVEKDRALIRFRDQLIKDERRLKQRIKMYIHYSGLGHKLNGLSWSKKHIEYLKKVAVETGDKYLMLILPLLEHSREYKLGVMKQIKALSVTKEYHQMSSLLQTIPGVSCLASMILITEIVDMNRFVNLDKLCSYIGLIPDTNNSSDTERDRGITVRKNRRLRVLIIEISWIAIRYDPQLSLAYANYCKKMRGQKAIIKIARKMAARIRYIWMNREPYHMST